MIENQVDRSAELMKLNESINHFNIFQCGPAQDGRRFVTFPSICCNQSNVVAFIRQCFSSFVIVSGHFQQKQNKTEPARPSIAVEIQISAHPWFDFIGWESPARDRIDATMGRIRPIRNRASNCKVKRRQMRLMIRIPFLDRPSIEQLSWKHWIIQWAFDETKLLCF